MSLGFGYNAWAGVGTETTYGTPTARQQFVEINSEGMAAADDVVTGNSVYNSAYDIDNIRQGRKVVAGNFSFDLRREGAELLLKYAMGTVAFGTLGVGGTCIQRTYTIPDTLGTSLCLEINRDAASFLYDGVKINEFTINGDNQGIVTVDMSVIAEDEGTIAVSTPSFSTSKYWMFQDAGLTYGGTTKCIRDWKITVNQNLTTDRYCWGSRFTKEPQRAGKLEVTGEMTVEFDGTSDWNQFQSMGTGALAATYTGDTLDGTVKESFVVTCPKTRFAGGVPQVGDSGMIMATIPFVAYSDGTVKPANIVMVNSVLSGTNY